LAGEGLQDLRGSKPVIAGTTDIADNFAAFIGYGGCLEDAIGVFETVG